MKSPILTLLFFILFFSFSLFSQNEDQIKERHLFSIKFDPTRLVLWENFSSDYSIRRINEYNLSCERSTGLKSSIEGEIGLTRFHTDYMPKRLNIDGDEVYNHYRYLEYSARSQTGFLSSISYKYYTKEVMQGFYFAPKLKYRLLRNQILSVYNSESKNETMNELFMTLNMGVFKQLSNNVSIDFYLGFGFRKSFAHFQYCDYLFSLNDGQQIYNEHNKIYYYGKDIFSNTVAWHSVLKTEFKRNICLGFKIGFGRNKK